MHKLSTVNNQDSSGKVVKALGAKCGGFKQLFFYNFNYNSGTNASFFTITL